MSIDHFGLQGKVCVVSGAGGGIGRSIAQRFTTHGAKVALVDRDLAAAREVAEQLRADGATVAVIACDISDKTSVEAAAAQVERELGPTQVLVNNAAMVRNGPLSELALDDWNALIGVNLTGFFICSQIFRRQMKAAGGGAIVHIASIAGSVPQPNSGAYSVSKAGVLMLSRHLALEWGGDGIRSNVVSPAMVITPLSQSIYDNAEVRAKREQVVPMHRIGLPQDIAAATVYLGSALSDYVTGQEILVDGGWSSAMLAMVPRPGFDKPAS